MSRGKKSVKGKRSERASDGSNVRGRKMFCDTIVYKRLPRLQMVGYIRKRVSSYLSEGSIFALEFLKATIALLLQVNVKMC